MKTAAQKPAAVSHTMVPQRRRFFALLVALTAFIPLLPGMLSTRSRRELSLREADFYRPQPPGNTSSS